MPPLAAQSLQQFLHLVAHVRHHRVSAPLRRIGRPDRETKHLVHPNGFGGEGAAFATHFLQPRKPEILSIVNRCPDAPNSTELKISPERFPPIFL